MRNRAGFTMMEMIIVLVIVGLMVASSLATDTEIGDPDSRTPRRYCDRCRPGERILHGRPPAPAGTPDVYSQRQELQLTDRATGTVLFTRAFDSTSAYPVATFQATQTQLDIYPHRGFHGRRYHYRANRVVCSQNNHKSRRTGARTLI